MSEYERLSQEASRVLDHAASKGKYSVDQDLADAQVRATLALAAAVEENAIILGRLIADTIESKETP